MKRTALITGLFLLTIQSIWSLQSVSLEVMTGATWIHSETYGPNGENDRDPDPIVYRFSAALPLYFTESLYFSPGLAFSGKSWQWVEENNWAMPVDPMWQDLYVMSFDLDLPVGYQLNFSKLSAGIFAGPSLKFRIPLWGVNQSERSDMTSYFLSEGRFFNVNAGLILLVPLSQRFTFTFKGESSLPLYNLWSSVGLPFVDGFTVSATAGVRFTL